MDQKLLESYSSRPLEGRELVTLRSAIPTRSAPLNALKLGTLVPGTMNGKCLVYEQNMNMNQRHDSKTCWCQASTCGGSPYSEMVQNITKRIHIKSEESANHVIFPCMYKSRISKDVSVQKSRGRKD